MEGGGEAGGEGNWGGREGFSFQANQTQEELVGLGL